MPQSAAVEADGRDLIAGDGNVVGLAPTLSYRVVVGLPEVFAMDTLIQCLAIDRQHGAQWL